MANLAGPITPSRQRDKRPATTTWGREGLSFAKHVPSPSLDRLSRQRGVSFSPSKRVVSYDSAHPTSTRKPFREEQMLLQEPETPTRAPRHDEPEWQDIEDEAQAGYAEDSNYSEGDSAEASSFMGFSPFNASFISSGLRRLSGGRFSRSPRTPPRRTAFGGPRSVPAPAPHLPPHSPHTPRARSQASSSSSQWSSRRQQDRTPRSSRSQEYLYDDEEIPQELPGSSKLLWDPSTPQILATYMQLGFNLVMMGLIVWAVWIFITTIRNDVDLKVEEYSTDILNEIDRCSQEYLRNNCQPGKRVPALETICTTWENCMNRDPKQVGRARVSAETFGEIVNSFLAPIGIKSMIFIVCAFAGSFILVNATFASRLGPAHFQGAQQHPMAYPQTPMASVPMTPSRHVLDYHYSARRRH